MKASWTGAALALLLAVAPAGAQDADQLRLAKEMLVSMRAADNFDAVVPAVMQAMKPAITAGNPKTAKDWDDIAPLMTAEFASMKGDLLNDIAAIYAKAFTTDELKAFVAFYKTPAGDKLARTTPLLTQQTMQAGQKFGVRVAERLSERMKEELRKRGNKI